MRGALLPITFLGLILLLSASAVAEEFEPYLAEMSWEACGVRTSDYLYACTDAPNGSCSFNDANGINVTINFDAECNATRSGWGGSSLAPGDCGRFEFGFSDVSICNSSTPIYDCLEGGVVSGPWCVEATGTGQSNEVCGKDLDGDGYFDSEGELTNCVNGVCTHDAVACTPTYFPHYCPGGGALDTDLDMCYLPPDSIDCPTGYSYDSSIDRCIRDVTCTDGGTFNPATERCEKLVQNECPSGYSYDASRDVCWKTVYCPEGTSFVVARDRCERTDLCPEGAVLDTDLDMCHLPVDSIDCPTGYSYDSSIDRCVRDVTCADGGTFNPATERCEKLVQNECPSGYSYDASRDVCWKTPDCPFGYTYVAAKDRCEKTTSISCPTGYTYNSTRQQCERVPDCPSGTTYNSTHKKCVVAFTPDCPTGYTYVAARDRCERNPVCSSGYTYDQTNDMCVATTPTCPTGYTYNATRQQCERVPDCLSGTTYNSTHKKCVVAFTPDCPTGYTYVAARDRCERNPVCSVGTYSATHDYCTDNYTPNCPTGYSFVSSRDRCERTPGCPSGYTYNASSNQCVSNTPSCPSGTTYDATYQVCYRTPTCPSGYTWNSSTRLCETSSSYPASLGGNGVSEAIGLNYYVGRVTVTGSTVRLEFPQRGVDNTSTLPSLPAQWQQSQWYVRAEWNGSNTAIRVANFTSADEGVLYGAWIPVTYSCPSGGTLSGSTCYTSNTTNPSCPSGYTYDSSFGVCYTSPSWPTTSASCPGGYLDTARDVCYASYNPACPSGMTYSSSLNMCIATPTCPNGGVMDYSQDVCQVAFTPTCPTGTTYDSAAAMCVVNPTCPSSGNFSSSDNVCHVAASYETQTPTCPNGGVMDYSQDVCQVAFTPTCPTGTTYDSAAAMCVVNPTCPSGGNFSSSDNVCQVAFGTDCGSTTYDSTNNVCYTDPVCQDGAYHSASNECRATITRNCGTYTWNDSAFLCLSPYSCFSPGSYSAALEKCVYNATHNCPANYSWSGLPRLRCEAVIICPTGTTYDSTNNVCYTDPVCQNGAYHSTANECRATITRNCGTYTWNYSEFLCLAPYSCLSPGSYSAALEKCVNNATHNCPANYSWTGLPRLRCEAVVQCLSGVYDPDENACYQGDYDCPHNGGNHTLNGWSGSGCADMDGSGVNKCSPYPCVDIDEPGNYEENEADLSSYQDDGKIDPETGECEGEFKIFNGQGSECLQNGIRTMFFNCCNPNPSSWLFFKKACPESSTRTAQAVQAEVTHYIGEYCKIEIPLIGCVQKADVHCRFNSKLARIVHQQGRPQLQKFAPNGNWGTAEAPNCEGFTPEEFQVLDFGKIDLSEFFGDIGGLNMPAVQESMQESLERFHQNVR